MPSAISPEEFARELRLAAAIHWYSRGQISQGKGAQIAGMDRRSFILALGRAGVDAIQVSAQELKTEVESELEGVVNASPIIFLDRVGLLDQLNEPGVTVFVPDFVLEELGGLTPDDPAAVAVRSASWIQVVAAPPIPDSL